MPTNEKVTETLGLSWDLSPAIAWAVVGLAVVGLVLLIVEVRWRRPDRPWVTLLTGVLSIVLCLGAVLRPVQVRSRGTLVGAKVLALVDQSRSIRLPGDDPGKSREDAVKIALNGLKEAGVAARISPMGFGEQIETDLSQRPSASRSELIAPLREAIRRSEERPSAVVVISDGRLDTPSAEEVVAMRDALGLVNTPVHTVAVSEREPRDASIRAVHRSGMAVSHHPFHLRVDVGCAGGLSCSQLNVSVRELLEGAPPELLANGVAHLQNGVGTVDLTITLDRAGPRLVEVRIDSPSGDEIPDNDRRYFAFDVARDRVRVLHVAGRPTYDVRALRMWLKSNAAVDTIAFFILRSDQDDTNADDSELALIRFPVEQLFTTELPTFDAVILQDFNAVPYKLIRHLPNLARYVETGGGLVMVGGPDCFLGGGYSGTPIEKVLPVTLDAFSSLKGGESLLFDQADVIPRATEFGRRAPMLAGLRALFGEELPPMPGANLVGDAKPNSLVLWEHPSRKTKTGKPMPLLTLGEVGDGRAVTLAVDGAHRLGFSEFAARAAGRGHGALWDGLLGWLMRDPRFEPAQIDLHKPCVAGEPMTLSVVPVPGVTGSVELEIIAADARRSVKKYTAKIAEGATSVDVPIDALEPGGYLAKMKMGLGATTRRAFACEKGGDEWADSRPDVARLKAIANQMGGTFVRAKDTNQLSLPAPTEVSAERSVRPLLPPWLWTVLAAVFMGLHWLARRSGGMA